MPDVVTIEGAEYKVDGEWLTLTEYDGIEAQATCTSGPGPSRLRFVRRGPRGGLHVVCLNDLTDEDARQLGQRLCASAIHMQRIERYRRERWGT